MSLKYTWYLYLFHNYPFYLKTKYFSDQFLIKNFILFGQIMILLRRVQTFLCFFPHRD